MVCTIYPIVLSPKMTTETCQRSMIQKHDMIRDARQSLQTVTLTTPPPRLLTPSGDTQGRLIISYARTIGVQFNLPVMSVNSAGNILSSSAAWKYDVDVQCDISSLHDVNYLVSILFSRVICFTMTSLFFCSACNIVVAPTPAKPLRRWPAGTSSVGLGVMFACEG
jgi:hypothetical protein